MKENLVVTEKGQITLPVSMRRSLGLGKRSVVQAEQVGGKIVLTPAMVIETELYSDEQIREWDKQDAFGKDERKKLESKLARRG
jgi:antitoxin PrlF